jgi:hypothetical protein
LVDKKAKIDNNLWILAMGCKNNLEKKAKTLPGAPIPEPVQPVAMQVSEPDKQTEAVQATQETPRASRSRKSPSPKDTQLKPQSSSIVKPSSRDQPRDYNHDSK